MMCHGAILAGGAATRYGGAPKGLETLHGVALVRRVANALRTAVDALVVVADSPAADDWVPGARRIPDLRPGNGALGGVHSALAHAAPTAVLVVAWDMPGVTGAMLRALRALGEAGEWDAVVPEGSEPGAYEPLCAWYASGCLAAIERRLDAGDRRASAWLADVRVRAVSRDELGAFGDPARLLANVNSPADLAALEHGAEPGSASDDPPPRG